MLVAVVLGKPDPSTVEPGAALQLVPVLDAQPVGERLETLRVVADEGLV